MKASIRQTAIFFSNNIAAFVLALVLLNLLIIKIPFHKLFIDFYAYETSKNIGRLIHGVIIVGVCILLIRKLDLVNLSGLRLFALKSPWLLLIPFIYPMALGLLNLSSIEPGKISWYPFLLAFLATMAKALAEEYAFRGLLQSYLIVKLKNRFSLFGIICMSSCVFGLMHIINISRYSVVDIINQVIVAFFFGVFFGALLLRTNNVFLLGIIHGGINFLFKLNSLVGNEVKEENNHLSTLAEIMNVIIRYTLFFLPLFVIGFFLIRGRRIEQLKLDQK